MYRESRSQEAPVLGLKRATQALSGYVTEPESDLALLIPHGHALPYMFCCFADFDDSHDLWGRTGSFVLDDEARESSGFFCKSWSLFGGEVGCITIRLNCFFRGLRWDVRWAVLVNPISHHAIDFTPSFSSFFFLQSKVPLSCMGNRCRQGWVTHDLVVLGGSSLFPARHEDTKAPYSYGFGDVNSVLYPFTWVSFGTK